MTKNELFNTDLQETGNFFKALGHPARLAILIYLAECNVCISGDISSELPLSRTTVNQHLKVLKEQGFIKGDISGTKVNYCIDNEKVKKIKLLLGSFLDKLASVENQNC